MRQMRDGPLGPGDLVLADFDGTVSIEDTSLYTITRLGLAEAWDLEYAWRRGEMGAPECLARQWGMVRLPRRELEALVDSVALDAAFPLFVAECRARGAQVAVLSDGLDLYVERGLQRLGLEPCPGLLPLPAHTDRLPVFVNHGEWTPEGLEVSFPWAWPHCDQCGNCKTAKLFALRPGHRRVIYVGDGYSDMCVARFADLLFAKDHLAEYCTRRRIPFLPFAGFADLRERLCPAEHEN